MSRLAYIKAMLPVWWWTALDTDAYNEIDDQFATPGCWASSRVRLQALYAAPFKRAQFAEDGMERASEIQTAGFGAARFAAGLPGAAHFLR